MKPQGWLRARRGASREWIVDLGAPARVGASPPVAVIVSASPLESAFEAPYADRAQAFGAGATKGPSSTSCGHSPS
jgi:hypothetical protein